MSSQAASAPCDARAIRVCCVVCERDAARPYRRGMYRIGAVAFDLVRCPCGMVYVDPRPDEATLATLYSDPEYYSSGYNLGVETENYFARKDELLALYDAQMAGYEREIGRSSGDLLELGSAGGFLLEAARRRGWRARGVELSTSGVEYARRELGLDVFQGELRDAPFAHASFDLVIADNVLEHTSDPRAVLVQLRERLRPGGHLNVIVPSYVNSPYFRALSLARRYLPRGLLGRQTLALLKLDGADAGLPYHILEFDRVRLARLVESAGFVIEGVERSLPLPAHVFKVARPDLRTRCLRVVFRTLDAAMRAGLAPAARVRIRARKPS